MLWIVNCVNKETKNVWKDLLEKLFEIEQDMWARGIWEYLNCRKCHKIFSKSDMYDAQKVMWLDSDVRLETVMQIERVLWWVPFSPCCHTEMKHVYEKEIYISDMKKRYMRKESFLTLAKKNQWEVIGFMDWYVASLEEIFDEELRFHFSRDTLYEIMKEFWLDRKQKLLTVSSIWTDDKNKSLLTIFKLLKSFFDWLDDSYDDLSGLVESIVWSTTYCIFNIMWAQKFYMPSKPSLLLPTTVNTDFETDILFQENVVKSYKQAFNIRLRDVAIYSRRFWKATLSS